MLDLKLEKASILDLEDVKALYYSVLNTKYCIWNEEYPSSFEINFDFEHHKLFVLKINDKVIGAASIVPENEMDGFDCWKEKNNTCEIARIVIHKDYQGKGYGKVLVSKLIDLVKEMSFKAIHLAVHIDHIPAYKTYLSAGFKEVGNAFMYNHNYKLMEKVF